jgi:hypothetical protein
MDIVDGVQCPGAKVLVKFEGVRDVVCFKENKISCMELHQITCINTNANINRVG